MLKDLHAEAADLSGDSIKHQRCGRRTQSNTRPLSSAAYSNAELRKKDLGLGRVLIFRKRELVLRLDESVSYQTIKRHSLVRG
jgi:hypothetical protein